MPGVQVNENCAVFDEDGELIGNLFAAGEVMFGNIFNRISQLLEQLLYKQSIQGNIAAETAVNELGNN